MIFKSPLVLENHLFGPFGCFSLSNTPIFDFEVNLKADQSNWENPKDFKPVMKISVNA